MVRDGRQRGVHSHSEATLTPPFSREGSSCTVILGLSITEGMLSLTNRCRLVGLAGVKMRSDGGMSERYDSLRAIRISITVIPSSVSDFSAFVAPSVRHPVAS
jgi:hypothetical protein